MRAIQQLLKNSQKMKTLENIKKWSLNYNINHSALRGLITIINEYCGKVILPQDPRTLMKTPKNVAIVPVGNGQYWHNGLRFCLEYLFSNISEAITISLSINFDGLPIFKSSKDEFWPILFNIAEMPEVKPMVIGIYCGKSKPSNLGAYLMPLVDEFNSIMSCGVHIMGHKITVKIRSFICDSPARAFIKGVHINQSHI